MNTTHPTSDRNFLNITAVFFILTALLLVVLIAPKFVDADTIPEPERGRSIIETGEARSDVVIVNRVNVTRTRAVLCENGTIHRPVQQTTVVLSESAAKVVNDVTSNSNSGGNGASAGGSGGSNDGQQITLRELGLLQLAAHDLFNVDRETEIDHENGDLDLSTLLAHGDEYIAIGGEPRNRENIMLFTVAKEYGVLYIKYLDRGNTPEQALRKLLKKYHFELREIFEELFHEDMPKPMAGAVTQTENLAFRTIHDMLPGHIKVDGEIIVTVDPSLIGKMLSEKELKAKSGELNGIFDPVFLDIVITIPPDTVFHINLFERDSSFAVQFSTDHSFEHFMDELYDGRYNKDEDVMHYIRNLFAKGLYFD